TAREVSAAVTTQESASGSINYALSYGTFDDFISVVLGSDWQAPQTIAGVAGDITLTNVSATAAALSSTTAGKFTNLNVGQWVRILGFSNTANNGFVRITAKADAQHLTVATLAAAVTETPAAAAAQVRAQTIMNGTQFKSLFIQQRLASDLWLRYPGCYVSAWTLAGGIGQFMNGAFSILAQQEMNQTADVSTGGILAAPSGKVMDPVGGFGGVLWNEVPVLATVDSFNLSFSNTGAAQEFGMGSSLAAGVLAGSMEVTGSIKMYFRDFTIYSRFKAETSGSLAFIMKDNASNAYIITLPSALLLNAQIAAGGPGQPVWATFQIEGNPQAGGGTVIVDKLPAI
ncbi:MAG TPA: phage tail tube protein, partial [Rhodopila sp.]